MERRSPRRPYRATERAPFDVEQAPRDVQHLLLVDLQLLAAQRVESRLGQGQQLELPVPVREGREHVEREPLLDRLVEGLEDPRAVAVAGAAAQQVLGLLAAHHDEAEALPVDGQCRPGRDGAFPRLGEQPAAEPVQFRLQQTAGRRKGRALEGIAADDLGQVFDKLEFKSDQPSFFFINTGETHYPYLLPGEKDEDLPHISGVHGVFKSLDEFLKNPGEFLAYRPDAEQSGKRALSNAVLSLLTRRDGGAAAQAQYDAAHDMTQQLAALANLIRAGVGAGALADFEARWQSDRLVMDKWFGLQIGATGPDKAAERAEALGLLEEIVEAADAVMIARGDLGVEIGDAYQQPQRFSRGDHVKLLEGDYLSIDQAALTGESLPVSKKAGDVACANTIVKQGEMLAVVVNTGASTNFHSVVALVARATKEAPDIQSAAVAMPL